MAMYLSTQLSFGQTPSNDPNYVSTPTFTDGFSSGSLSTSGWQAKTGVVGSGNIIITAPNGGNFIVGEDVVQVQSPTITVVGAVSCFVKGTTNTVLILNTTSGQFDCVHAVVGSDSHASITPSTVQSDANIILSGGSSTGFNLGDQVHQPVTGATGIIWNIPGGTGNPIWLNATSGTFDGTDIVTNGTYTYTPTAISSTPANSVDFVTTTTISPYTLNGIVSQSSSSGNLMAVINNTLSGTPKVVIINASLTENFYTTSSINIQSNNYTPVAIAPYGTWAEDPSAVSFSTTIKPGETVLHIQASARTVWGSAPVTTGYITTPQPINPTGPYNFGYGYYEASMELPTYGKDYNDAFWLWDWCAGWNNPPQSEHNELDCEILNYSANVQPGKTSPPVNYSTTTWVGNNLQGCSLDKNGTHMEYLPSSSLATSFHVYSFEYTHDYITYYFDGVPFRTILRNNPNTFIPVPPLAIVLDLGMSSAVNSYYDTYPADMYVEYVHYYGLNDDCGRSIIFTQNSGVNSISSYSYAVENYITFGDGSHSLNLGPSYTTPPAGGKAFVFRSVNGFTIPKYSTTDFTVPAGKAFMLIPTGCSL